MIVRAAGAGDLASMYLVYYLNEVSEVEAERISASPPETVPATLRHVFETGTMALAEQDGQVLAFAGAITRGEVTFLADLFVRPQTQSGGLGKALLQEVLPHEPSVISCTMSSTDPRAQALYTRQGMQPLLPHFNLRWQGRVLTESEPVAADLEVVEGEVGDPAFVQWDAQVGGRARPVDHIFWLEQQHAMPLWFRRKGVTLGYGYVRQVEATLLNPRMLVVGPLGVSAPEHATECVLAATNWARQRAELVRIDVPGPHPCLAPLLERGFHIIYVETFHTTGSFFDARCYIPSGSDLL